MACECKYVSFHWEPSRGKGVPKDAIEAGMQTVIEEGELKDELIYVARGRHDNNIIPGNLVPSHKTCYIAYDFAEIGLEEYEVLCNPHDCKLEWVSPTKEHNIPTGAIQGGMTESNEPLYIGRTKQKVPGRTLDEHWTHVVGKVQPSHGCLYIPYAGSEIRSTDYEILVCSQLILK